MKYKTKTTEVEVISVYDLIGIANQDKNNLPKGILELYNKGSILFGAHSVAILANDGISDYLVEGLMDEMLVYSEKAKLFQFATREYLDENFEVNEPPPGMNHFCCGESGSGEWSCRSEDVPSRCGYCGEPNEALCKQEVLKV